MKRKDKTDKRLPFAGVMLMLLYFSKKAKVLIVIGALLTAIGFIGGSYFSSIVITETSQGKMNQVTSTPILLMG